MPKARETSTDVATLKESIDEELIRKVFTLRVRKCWRRTERTHTRKRRRKQVEKKLRWKFKKNAHKIKPHLHSYSVSQIKPVLQLMQLYDNESSAYMISFDLFYEKCEALGQFFKYDLAEYLKPGNVIDYGIRTKNKKKKVNVHADTIFLIPKQIVHFDRNTLVLHFGKRHMTNCNIDMNLPKLQKSNVSYPVCHKTTGVSKQFRDYGSYTDVSYQQEWQLADEIALSVPYENSISHKVWFYDRKRSFDSSSETARDAFVYLPFPIEAFCWICSSILLIFIGDYKKNYKDVPLYRQVFIIPPYCVPLSGCIVYWNKHIRAFVVSGYTWEREGVRTDSYATVYPKYNADDTLLVAKKSDDSDDNDTEIKYKILTIQGISI